MFLEILQSNEMTPPKGRDRHPCFGLAVTCRMIAVALAVLTAPARAQDRQTIVFIDAGKPAHMKVIGKPWTTQAGRIECEGSGDRRDRLVTGHAIGPGSFRVKARLTIFDLDRGAGSFRFGMNNGAIFGFEGAHGAMYVAGKFFNADPHTGKIGDPGNFIRDGEPFDLELIREGDQLRIVIDGEPVHERTVSPAGLGPAGFVPIRTTMAVEHFSVTANFAPFSASEHPVNVNDVARITIHPLVTELPDLKLGPFVRLSDGSILTVEEKSAFVSRDEGKTWTEIRIFEEGRNSARAYVSTDDGATWTKSRMLDVGGEQGDHSGTIEGTLVELEDGRLWTLLRTYRGRFYEAYSSDKGRTWSPQPPAPSNIGSTGSPGMLKRLSDGRLVLFWNAIPNEGFVRREELSVAFSSDEGKTWTEPLVIARNPSGRVSYPYVFESEPGILWVTTMQGNFRGRMKTEELHQAAISNAPPPEFYRSSKHFKEYISLPVKDVGR